MINALRSIEPPIPHALIGHSPLRRPGSIRRTMTIEVHWPDHDPLSGHFHGRARDICTPIDRSNFLPIAHDMIDGRFADHRTIETIARTPPSNAVASLAGARAGFNLRGMVQRDNTPLHLLLDDLTGASLVSPWGWGLWHPSILEMQRASASTMTGVCIGLRPGSSALNAREGPLPNSVGVVALPNPSDPAGWHDFFLEGHFPNFRRARLIDLWREERTIRVESIFQDTASTPAGGLRAAIHEYRLSATIDFASSRLLTLKATPGTLPYAECPAATANLSLLLGTPMDEIRDTVLDRLRRTAGCTHLNDMIRSLAEVPALMRTYSQL